jgi:hypothetical protein
MEETKRQEIMRTSGIFLIQIVLLIWVGLQHPDRINPDGISYIRIAQYYASGQFDLMISGYWGPLLSWLIVPFLAFVKEPLSAAHIAMGLSAIVYLLGCMAIFRAMGIGSFAMLVALGIVVLFSVRWSVYHITPDLLMSGILCLAISRVMHPDWCDNKPWVQISAGLLFGAAYLAKAVALPLSGILIMAAGLLWAICRQTSPTRALRSAAITFLGLILIAGPWILVLSFKYERPVFSTSAEINHTIVGPASINRGHPTSRTFHVPQNGRISSWEDPSLVTYVRWSPFDSLKNMKHQLRVIRENVDRILFILKNFDWLGIGLVAVIFGFLLHAPWKQNIRLDRWRWSAIFIGCLAGIYLPVAARSVRYYLATYPFLLGGSLCYVGHLAKSLSGQVKMLPIIALTLVSLSFLVPLADSFSSLSPNTSYQAAKVLKGKLKAINITGPIASTSKSDKIAMYTAFLMEVPYHGKSPKAETVEDVESSAAKIIIVDRGTLVDLSLSQDKSFMSLDERMFDSLGKDAEPGAKVYINTKI